MRNPTIALLCLSFMAACSGQSESPSTDSSDDAWRRRHSGDSGTDAAASVDGGAVTNVGDAGAGSSSSDSGSSSSDSGSSSSDSGSSSPTVCTGQCRYVRAGATGDGTGTDWTNACTGFDGACAISALVRGNTYFVADGDYGAQSFDTPASGALAITIKKATTTDHGTSTGWSDAYGAGQATFGSSLQFFSNNWVFDGVKGSDFVSGHGFKVDNSKSTDTTLILFGQPGGAGVTNVTVAHIDLVGAGYDQTNVNDRGFYSNSTGGSNYTISHNFVSGVGVPFLTRQVNTMLVEYNQIEGNHSQPESHGEPWSDTGTDNVTFRFNRIENPEGTAVFFVGNGSAGDPTNDNTSSNWQIYGNVFYYRNYVVGAGHDPGTAAVLWCPPSEYGGDTYCDNWLIYNNTFYDFSYGTSSGRILARTGTSITIPVVRNNIWDSSSDGAYHVNVNASFDYYRNTQHDAEADEQIGVGNPFVNAAGGDFHLSAATQAGMGLPSPYDRDMDGSMRGADGIWDRGAYEFRCARRPIAIAQNGASRSHKTRHPDHRFRRIAITQNAASRSPISAHRDHRVT